MFQQMVTLPGGRPAPMDGDELMENPEIRGIAFRCPKCEAPYAEIVAFKVVLRERAA